MKIGYEIFNHPPGEVDEQRCLVCGAVCDIERNVEGYTCWSGAMAGKKRMYDYFECPHAKEGWHLKALNLIVEIEKTDSDNLKALIMEDLDRVVKEKAQA